MFHWESLELELEVSDDASSWEASLWDRLVSREIDWWPDIMCSSPDGYQAN